MTASPASIPTVVGPGLGKTIQIGGFGTTYKIVREGAGAAVIEHTLAPFQLAAPLHRHTHEDEISYVLAGAIGFQQSGEVSAAGPGSYVLKPRGIFHTFWNRGATPARLIEIIAPAGFERYFEELGQIVPVDGPPDMDEIITLADRYGLEFDLGSVPALVETHGLRFG